MLMILHRHYLSGNLAVTLIISGVILLIGSTFLLFVLPGLAKPQTRIFLGDGVFFADVASNQTAREIGLSNKHSMKPDQALLMAFPTEDRWGIWMKDMNFPIDIVWLNKDKKVVYMVMNAPPDDQVTVYKPNKLAKYVIELPGGTVVNKAINANNTAIFDLEEDVK